MLGEEGGVLREDGFGPSEQGAGFGVQRLWGGEDVGDLERCGGGARVDEERWEGGGEDAGEVSGEGVVACCASRVR